MSMWEFEALGEEAVNMVSNTGLPLSDKRQLYANIYALTGCFDVSFTHFRNAAALTEAQFFNRIDLNQHPDYTEHKPYLDSVAAAGESEWISFGPKDEHGYREGPADGLYEPSPHNDTYQAGLWFDPSMPLWQKAVDAGLITGLAAEPVTYTQLQYTVARLITLAAEVDSEWGGLLKMLHGMASYVYSYDETPPKAGEPPYAAVRDLPALKAALTTPQEDWIDERFNARQAIEWAESDEKVWLDWWCGPYKG